MNRSPYLGRILVRWLGLAALSSFFAALPAPQPVVDRHIDPGANNIVRSLAVQADGKIFVARDFMIVGHGVSL
jgi:hypothetical protein